MDHYEVDLRLRILPDINYLWDASADHFVVVLTVAPLVWRAWVTAIHAGPAAFLLIKLNDIGVGKFTAIVCKEHWEDFHENVRPEFKIQPFKYIDH